MKGVKLTTWQNFSCNQISHNQPQTESCAGQGAVLGPASQVSCLNTYEVSEQACDPSAVLFKSDHGVQPGLGIPAVADLVLGVTCSPRSPWDIAG